MKLLSEFSLVHEWTIEKQLPEFVGGYKVFNSLTFAEKCEAESELRRKIADEAKVIDYTDRFASYLDACNRADIDGSVASQIEVSTMHAAIMRDLGLEHEEECDRECFAKVLRAYRVCRKHGGIVAFVIPACTWSHSQIFVGTEKYGVYGDSYDWATDDLTTSNLDKSEALFFGYEAEDWNGIEIGDSLEYRSGSCNGSSGYYHNPDKCRITPEMEAKVREMGLIPVIVEHGSYHENWLHVAGVYPEMYGEYLATL